VLTIRRLAWAGVELRCETGTAVIDLVEDFPWLAGDPPAGQIPPSPEPASAAVALVTHLHRDHADPVALARTLRPGGVVLRPEHARGNGTEVALVAEREAAFDISGLNTRVVGWWDTVTVGPFTVTALPAADGFGDPQVSWFVAVGGSRVLHAGDTLFHGWWWRIALRHGPFDAVFLPIGGAVVDLPARQPPSPLAAGMDPTQAAVAAKLLGAALIVPIHYGPLHQAANYRQVEDPAGALKSAARQLDIDVRGLEPGGELTLDSRA